MVHVRSVDMVTPRNIQTLPTVYSASSSSVVDDHLLCFRGVKDQDIVPASLQTCRLFYHHQVLQSALVLTLPRIHNPWLGC